MTTVYKIRRTTDGLFSMGGTYPRFNKNGKVWKTRAALSNHLSLVNDAYYERVRPTHGGNMHMRCAYDDCEIVCYELVETESDVMTINEYIADKDRKKAERKAEIQRRKADREKNARRQQYEQLKREFDNE